MRILHTSDWHININATRMGKPSTSAVTRSQRLIALRYVIQYGIDNGATVFVIAGDVFDKAQPWGQDYADLISILDMIPDTSIILMIFGNHDEFTTKGAGLQAIKERRNNIFIALELETFSHKGYNFILAPWGSKLDDIRNIIDGTKYPCILVLHGGVKDENHHWVEVEGEEGNYHLDDLKGLGCKAVMLGHYHNQAELAPGIWYAGSPDNVHGFSEENDIKGALLWNIGEKVTQISTTPLIPNYHTFTPEEFLGDDGTNNHFTGYIRIKGEVDDKERLQILKKLSDYKCLDYKVDLTNKTKKVRVFELKGNTDQEILENYFAQKGIKDTKELLKLDKELSK